MSYILEALKKAEQERVRGVAPTLHTVNVEPFREPRRPGRYLLAVALLSAVGVAGWLQPWRSEKGGVTVRAPAPVAERERSVPPVQPAAQGKVAKGATDRAAPVGGGSAPAAAARPPALPKPQALPRAASEQDILDYSELPVAVQRALPKLAVSGYVNYSGEPSGRMVALGDQLVREGEEVRAGLKLEQIRLNEVVFSYKGYRFRVGAP